MLRGACAAWGGAVVGTADAAVLPEVIGVSSAKSPAANRFVGPSAVVGFRESVVRRHVPGMRKHDATARPGQCETAPSDPELGWEVRTLRLSDLRPRAFSCCRRCAIAARGLPCLSRSGTSAKPTFQRACSGCFFRCGRPDCRMFLDRERIEGLFIGMRAR